MRRLYSFDLHHARVEEKVGFMYEVFHLRWWQFGVQIPTCGGICTWHGSLKFKELRMCKLAFVKERNPDQGQDHSSIEDSYRSANKVITMFQKILMGLWHYLDGVNPENEDIVLYPQGGEQVVCWKRKSVGQSCIILPSTPSWHTTMSSVFYILQHQT